MALENFGYDEGLVMGTVVAVVNSDRADLLILADKSNPTYPNVVACEFFGERNRGLLEGVAKGDHVKVVGSIRSREYKGRWYTTYSCFAISQLDAVKTPAPPEERPAPRKQHREETDDVPF